MSMLVSLTILMGQSKYINQRAEHTMVKRKRTRPPTKVDKTLQK